MSSVSHILCAVDFSESARHALAQAAAVAQAYDAGVTVLHAVVNRPSMDLPPVSLGDAEQERLVEDLRHFSENVAPSLSASYSVREAVSAHARWVFSPRNRWIALPRSLFSSMQG